MGVKMKIVQLKKDDPESIENAAKILRQSLIAGDVILSAPIPKNFFNKYVNIAIIIIRRYSRGITHSCLYLGNNQVLDIDYKIIRPGPAIEKIALETLLKNKIDFYGGVIVYVVKPKHYNKKNRMAAVKHSFDDFLKNQHKITHGLFGTVKLALRYRFRNNKKYPEDFRMVEDWTCTHMVAHILKRSGAKIGRRASYTFIPMTFLFSKNFKTKSKLILQ